MKSLLILAFVAYVAAAPLNSNLPLVQLIINLPNGQGATSVEEPQLVGEIQPEQPASAFEVQIAPGQQPEGADQVQVAEVKEEEKSFIEYLKDRYRPSNVQEQIVPNDINDIQGLLHYLKDRYRV